MNLQVSDILTSHFPGRDWILRKPTAGMTGESYIATSDGLEIFIKFDVEAPALQRVAELGIAPRVLAAGRHEGRLYIVQEYVQGIRPEREWFPLHLPQLADLIRVYQGDPVLAALLSKGKQLEHAEYIDSELRGFATQLAGLSDPSHRAELSPLMAELRDQSRAFEPVDLVPTHADPNFYNFLVADERIYLLDWDAASLSDPMRDVGPLLWWYVPPDKWHEFFTASNIEMNDQMARKVYWWAARQSCMVALLFAASAYPQYALPFIVDFRAALRGQPNPHA
ncbi:MAG: phosphotransferase [Chloroflexota bacterium]|nr:phosphotransferase [Chloroflexota bacterium]MDQ5867421.1 phosphotransferase [Chloroflexota bacterium]